jgi:tetratricopeptide (TPR) repeat protein
VIASTTHNIFISYRREDAAAYAGRLSDHLAPTVGTDRIFMDVEDIAPGQNFAEAIDRSIASCDTALVVIGPRWTRILRERAESQQADYLYHEVSSALAHNLRIVPVLVGGASMPVQADLPAALSALCFQQASELRDSTFKDDCERLAAQLGLGRSRASAGRKWLLTAGIVVAVLLLWGLWRLGGRGGLPADPRLATARTQSELGEFQSAFRTYGEILSTTPHAVAVQDLQADAAMAWVRDFRVTVPEGQTAEEIAGPPLAGIIGVLEAALARTDGRGRRAGDILAHLGWAHWLNGHIAAKEFGPAAERSLRRSLSADPDNVFAHAMLGNWLLQNHGDTAEALRHFEAAEKSNHERPLLRTMQLGAMIYNQQPGIPSALMRVANQMRRNNEPVSERNRSRILSYFRPGNRVELSEMLSAVPPQEAWETFLWLDNSAPQGDLRREFIHARVLELEGKTSEAIGLLAGLRKRLLSTGSGGRLLDDVSEQLNRLRSAPPHHD